MCPVLLVRLGNILEIGQGDEDDWENEQKQYQDISDPASHESSQSANLNCAQGEKRVGSLPSRITARSVDPLLGSNGSFAYSCDDDQHRHEDHYEQNLWLT